MISDRLVEVHILQIPVPLWQRATAHHEAIQREFDIIRATLPIDAVPNRLHRLIEEFDARFGAFSQPTWDELRRAAEAGATTKDLVFKVPEAAADAARQLGQLLAEVDEYCRQGSHLVTLATPDELVAFRKWLLGEFVDQIANDFPPRQWADYVLAPGQPRDPEPQANGDEVDTIVFSGPLDLTTAGLLRDEIQRRRKKALGKLTVDLSGVGFVDSIGVGLLITTQNRLASEGIEMRLVAAKRLQDLLALSGLTDLLKPEAAGE